MLNMTTIVTALAPAFAVGLGIQHLNELLDAVFSAMAGANTNRKKLFMGLSSLFFGGAATLLLNLHIVQLLTDAGSQPGVAFRVMDGAVTALIISTGTEGINSIVKFLGYAKDQKGAAVVQAAGAAGAAIRGPNG
jgi:hypothetical protein